MVSKVVRKVKDRLGPYDDTASLSHIEAAPRMYENQEKEKRSHLMDPRSRWGWEILTELSRVAQKYSSSSRVDFEATRCLCLCKPEAGQDGNLKLSIRPLQSLNRHKKCHAGTRTKCNVGGMEWVFQAREWGEPAVGY